MDTGNDVVNKAGTRTGGERPLPENIPVPGGKIIKGWICPRCGNQVGRHAHKYTCPHCRQELKWDA